MNKKIKESLLGLISGFFVPAIILFYAFSASAELKPMTEKEMRKETAQAGMASFSKNEDTVRMFMDIHLETWTDIDSMKIGYYDNNSTGLGWDQNWTDVKIGTVDTPMQMDGFVFKADFKDLQTSDKPILKRLVIGTNRLIGTMEANIESFTGVYNPLLTDRNSTALVPDENIRKPLGQTTFTFDSPDAEDKEKNEGFFIVITPPSTDSAHPVSHPGIQIIAGYNELNISASPFSDGEWWDK